MAYYTMLGARTYHQSHHTIHDSKLVSFIERQFAIVVNRAYAMMIVAEFDEVMGKKLWAVSSATLCRRHRKCDNYFTSQCHFTGVPNTQEAPITCLLDTGGHNQHCCNQNKN